MLQQKAAPASADMAAGAMSRSREMGEAPHYDSAMEMQMDLAEPEPAWPQPRYRKRRMM